MQQAQPCLCLRCLNESEHEGQLCLYCIQSTLLYDTDTAVAYGLSKDKCITEQILTTYFRGNKILYHHSPQFPYSSLLPFKNNLFAGFLSGLYPSAPPLCRGINDVRKPSHP